MRLPGLAWLELRVEPGQQGGKTEDAHADGSRATFALRAIFHPHGLAGHLYWWSVRPFHGVVFGGMLRNVAERAERAGS